MADPTAIVPCHEPYMIDWINALNVSTPNFSDLSSDQEPNLFSQSIPGPPSDVQHNLDFNQPFDDAFIWAFDDEFLSIDPQEGPSENHGGTSNSEDLNFGAQNLNPLSIWPSCSCCEVLREIIHTNGNTFTKLEIHGRVGIICHAILSVNATSNGPQYEMFELCNKTMENVKKFLVDYCNERKQQGYMMLHNPLSYFYEALCVGLDRDRDQNIDVNDICEPISLTNPAIEFQMDQALEENELERMPKYSLAEQRARTKELTLEDLRDYYDMPIDTAAKTIKVCPTVVKRVCRKNGLDRWPYRRVSSIKKQILRQRNKLNSYDEGERVRAQAKIYDLEQELARIYAGGQ